MPSYRYRAVHTSGRVAQGNLTAANEYQLAQYLNDSGLELIEARTRRDQSLRLRLPKRTPPRALANFAGQMEDILKAGVPFVEALADIAKTLEAGALRDALSNILNSISQGQRIASAFAAYPRLFPPVFTAILAAGERSGDLPHTFERLKHYAESRARTSEQLRKAIRYPLFLMTVTFGVVGFMMTIVVPQIIRFLSTIDSELPPLTRILIGFSEIVAEDWWMLMLAVLTAIAGLHIARRLSADAVRRTDGWLLRIPVIGMVLEKLAFARFAHSFSVLFQSGLGVPDSMRHAKATMANRALEAQLSEAEERIQSGYALSNAMKGIFPAFALRMLRTGEKTGQLSKSLNDIAAAYDREVNDATEKLIGALEPALTIVIGAILAWVVLAVLGPIYGSLSKLNMMN